MLALLTLIAALCLAVVPAVAQPWDVGSGENLVANPSFEELDADGWPVGWSHPAVYSTDTEHARTGERSLKLVNDDPERYLLCTQRIELQPGKRYEIGAFVRTEGLEGSDTGATICVEWRKPDGTWMGGNYPSGRKGDTDEWTPVGGITGRIPEDATGFTIACYVRREMTGAAWWDDVSVRLVRERPLSTALLEPSYRGWVTADGPDAALIRASFVLDDVPTAPEDLRLVARLLDGDGVERARAEVGEITGEDRLLSLPLPDLAPGEHRLTIDLVDKRAGEVICTDDYPIVRREGPPPHAFIDEHNRLIVDGEPVFPLGMYWSGINEDELKRYVEAPFNCLMPYGSPNAEQMDLAQRYGLSVIYSIKDYYFGTRYCPAGITSEADEEPAVRARVRQYRDHPALLAWYLNDELPVTMMDRLVAHQRWVEEEDPNHPTWVVLYQIDQVGRYLRSFDVIGTDPYPIPHRPASLAAEWTIRTREAVGDSRAIWMVPQAFNWGSVRDDREYRPPTRDEMRSMTWQCICEGADGLVYYSWFNMRRDPSAPFEERWEDLKAVVGEVAEMVPVLLSIEPTPEVTVTGDAAIHWTVRTLNGAHWLMMVNDAPEAATTSVRFADPPAQVMLGDAQLPLDGGELRLEFAPLEVKLLRWGG